MARNHPDKPFARYADDAVAYCRSRSDAEKLHDSLKERFAKCGLELHPTKTRIVYCKDDDRWGEHPETKFDFLGYTFRPRRSKNKYGKYFVNFTPAVSNKAKKAMRQAIHDWIHLEAIYTAHNGKGQEKSGTQNTEGKRKRPGILYS